MDGHGRVDDQTMPNTGVGPRAFDDRGAFEYTGPGGDAPPSAALTVTPSSGSSPLAVTADASGSADSDSTPIATYTFAFGDGSGAGPQSPASATHTYTSPGSFTVTVTVTDTAGLSSMASSTVTVTPSTTTTTTPPTTTTAPPTTTTTPPTTTTTPPTTTTTPNGAPNLVGNPGFETATTGWGPVGTGITLQRVPGGHGGSWSALLSNTTSAPATITLNDSPNWVAVTQPGTYTASLWVRADTPGQQLKLKLREYQGSTLLGQPLTALTLTTSWQLVTVSYAPVAPGASTLDLTAYVSSAPAGATVYADDASIVFG
jgi:PKD domain/Carbohydrate binding domain